MDRRNSIKLILAAAVAPAFIAQGLMPVKPTAELMQLAGIDLYGTNSAPPIPASMLQIIKEQQDAFNMINGHYMFIVHPDMKSELLKKAAKDPRYLAHVKWMDRNVIESEYAPLPNGLLVSKNMINNYNGFIKPTWEDQNE